MSGAAVRFVVALGCGLLPIAALLGQTTRTESVLLVTLDGLRWQELFAGADETLIDAETGRVGDVEDVRDRFWRDSAEERRQALLPFFWSEVARRGQVFGDPRAGSSARVTNGKNFSYPGYNEILAGRADDRIRSNDKIPNPNTTVLEWLHGKADYRGRVSAHGSWDVFPYIVNEERSGVPVNAGWEPLDHARSPERAALFEEMRRGLPRVWDTVRYDVLTLESALADLEAGRRRVVYVAFGETDDWAHQREYDLYLDAARRSDDFLRRLWQAIEGDDRYAGRTSLVITTDHGRGGSAENWTSHGAEVAGSDLIWIAVLGPDTPALGIRRDVEVTQSQVAATVAALLGERFDQTQPGVAPPLPGVVARVDDHVEPPR